MGDVTVFENPYCRCGAYPCLRVFCRVCGAMLASHMINRTAAIERGCALAGVAHACGPDPYEFGGFRRLGPLVTH